jgi:hypothetical protein
MFGSRPFSVNKETIRGEYPDIMQENAMLHNLMEEISR